MTRFTGQILAAGSARDFAALPPAERGGETGAVELEVRFPDGMSGSTEPLVVTGMSGAGDLLYVHYVDPTHVAFGFHHWGISTLTGVPIEIDYSQPHRIEATMDSLYPAASGGRPFSGRLRVALDGVIALEGAAECFPSAPYEIRLGSNPLGGSVSDAAFTGKILSVERKPPTDLAPAAWSGRGAIKLETLFPSGLTHASEPLVESGRAGAADLIFVRYDDEHHVRFGLDHWGTAAAMSEPVEVDYGVSHTLELTMDALLPSGRPPAHQVQVRLDGVAVWTEPATNYPTSAEQIHIAINRVGASSCGANYTGQILSLTRPSPGP